MKKLLIATSIAAASIVSPFAMAAEKATEAKQAASFLTGAVTGAVAGGPVGALVGAVAGIFVGEEIRENDENQLAMTEQTMQIAELKTQLAKADAEIGELTEVALDKLEFQVLFHTGADKLTNRGQARVAALASFLQQHPGLSVRLTGHADPRGTDEYNNVLSDQRAIAVQEGLAAAGISDYRIERRAFGALESVSQKGDFEAYAMDRRVDIEIFNPVLNPTMVQAH